MEGNIYIANGDLWKFSHTNIKQLCKCEEAGSSSIENG
jgi:hypothetical protein